MVKKLFVCIMALMMLVACQGKEDKNISTMTGKEKIVIAFGGNVTPFSYVKQAQSDYSVYCSSDQFLEGFDVRVARFLSSTLNREIEAKKMNKQQALEALANQEIDLYLNALTSDRVSDVALSDVYYEEGFAVVVLKEGKCAKFTNVAKFKNKVLTSLIDSQAYACISTIDKVKAHEGFATYEEAFNALKAKEVDGVVAPISIAKKYASTNDKFKVLTFEEGKGFEATMQYVIAMNYDIAQEEEGLYQEINQALKNLDEETKAEWMKQALK